MTTNGLTYINGVPFQNELVDHQLNEGDKVGVGCHTDYVHDSVNMVLEVIKGADTTIVTSAVKRGASSPPTVSSKTPFSHE